jgi:hypothetical protein
MIFEQYPLLPGLFLTIKKWKYFCPERRRWNLVVRSAVVQLLAMTWGGRDLLLVVLYYYSSTSCSTTVCTTVVLRSTSTWVRITTKKEFCRTTVPLIQVARETDRRRTWTWLRSRSMRTLLGALVGCMIDRIQGRYNQRQYHNFFYADLSTVCV